MDAPVIRLDTVTRAIGDCIAVNAASATLSPGEIHAIIGENGAGKSTLLKLAAGVVAPTSGRVFVGDSALSPATPAEAIRRGVGMVHQHFMLVSAFTALENLMLGAEPVGSFGRLDPAAARAKAQAIADRTGLAVPLDAVTESLSVGERQRLEILRVLYRGARAILLDEPTAVLSPLEADELYKTLRSLADDGATIAVVTHRLDEVSRFADRVTVLRRGKVVLARPYTRAGGGERREGDLTRAIMGGDPPLEFARPELPEGAPIVLEIKGLSLSDAGGQRRLSGIDLAVHQGEIVGVAGIEGNGQRELVRALAGLEPGATGRVAVAARDLTASRSARAAPRSASSSKIASKRASARTPPSATTSCSATSATAIPPSSRAPRSPGECSASTSTRPIPRTSPPSSRAATSRRSSSPAPSIASRAARDPPRSSRSPRAASTSAPPRRSMPRSARPPRAGSPCW